MFRLTQNQLDQLHQHAERTYPEECCGILLGTIDRQSLHKTLVEPIATPNAWSQAAATQIAEIIAPSRYAATEARRDRYWIDPADLLRVQKQARDRNLQVIGFYHSHPDHVAEPSETDRILAWADYSYLIVSVQAGKVAAVRSWQLNDDRQFAEEAIEWVES